ncbi:MAG TPA: hypothetical protein VF824_06020 [Thermoanaerobaculia bacterium]|jgi:hypothetical protein
MINKVRNRIGVCAARTKASGAEFPQQHLGRTASGACEQLLGAADGEAEVARDLAHAPPFGQPQPEQLRVARRQLAQQLVRGDALRKRGFVAIIGRRQQPLLTAPPRAAGVADRRHHPAARIAHFMSMPEVREQHILHELFGHAVRHAELARGNGHQQRPQRLIRIATHSLRSCTSGRFPPRV